MRVRSLKPESNLLSRDCWEKAVSVTLLTVTVRNKVCTHLCALESVPLADNSSYLCLWALPCGSSAWYSCTSAIAVCTQVVVDVPLIRQVWRSKPPPSAKINRGLLAAKSLWPFKLGVRISCSPRTFSQKPAKTYIWTWKLWESEKRALVPGRDGYERLPSLRKAGRDLASDAWSLLCGLDLEVRWVGSRC